MMAVVFTFILTIVNIVSVLAFGFILSWAIPRGLIRWLASRLNENSDSVTDELYYMRATLGGAVILICFFDSILLWAPDAEALNMFAVAEMLALFMSLISFTCSVIYEYIQDYYYAGNDADNADENNGSITGNDDVASEGVNLSIAHGKIR